MDIDINTLRGISTLLVMVAFLAVCLWTYSSKRKSGFDKAAHLPFADEHLDEPCHTNTPHNKTLNSKTLNNKTEGTQ